MALSGHCNAASECLLSGGKAEIGALVGQTPNLGT